MEMIDMNILDILKNKYKECEPIFDYEIYALGFTDKDIEDTIKDNEFEELDKIDIVPCRIFYLVGYNEKFNIYILDCSRVQMLQSLSILQAMIFSMGIYMV